ncbi:hypothetical protein B0H66DRAFT_2687 [Apodospora peruviana]|uniref:SWIM-type domain-containing protein n=1 Tax=Apodospora peruviana TaxID=516989 RepID=A0AAE0IPM6_9PEZI|nr:hypothetical protein B0H66DRAFT_2687 [Apodospora peruviana]
MSVSPTTALSRLSLDCAPTSNPQPESHMHPLHRSVSAQDSSQDSDESDWDEDEDTRDVVCSPTGLKYNIAHLSPKTQKVVRELFNETSIDTPPQISLELCGIKEADAENDDVFYAFQMHEVVPCSVRIGSRHSTRFSTPRCECPDARYRDERPCKHLVWLFDKISKQTLFDHDPESELTLSESGYAQELGDPFQQISEIRLDVLADSLHCDISAPNCDTAPPNRARVKEAREMVAAVAGIDPREIGGYRTDLENTYNSAALIHRGDLEATLFSLILASHSLAAWMREELSPSDLAVDPFRMLQQRVSRIISELDAYSSSLQNPTTVNARRDEGKEAEGPRNVTWAATQITHCVRQIEKLISRGAAPLVEWERASAARALVGILKAVANHSTESHAGSTVDDRNLYMLLVGNHDTGFVFSALDMLVDQSQFIEELEDIMDLLGRFGAPATYSENMRGLIMRMRSYKGGAEGSSSVPGSAGGSMAGAGGGGGGGKPRSKTPMLVESAPSAADHHRQPASEAESVPTSSSSSGGPRSGSTSGQFLTPELPASASRRGSRSGTRGRTAGRGSRGSGSAGGASASLSASASGSSATGSKRSVSGSGQDRGRGSKRAR